MKPLAEQTHYDVLEIAPDANRQEIERAYRLARATYAEGGLATYSVFGDEDVDAICQRIEAAYEVLSDESGRHHYDATLVEREFGQPSYDAGSSAAPLETRAPASRPELPAAFAGFEDIDDGDQSDLFDGARLRRLRLLRGVEVEQIAEITKVNPIYLRFIEDDRFDDLPAPVYVRGFVTAYARCLGLDPAAVASSYVEQLYESRDRSRLQERD